MSYETKLYTWTIFLRETFNHKSEVEEKLREAKNAKELAKNTLKSLVFMTEPHKFFTVLEKGENVYLRVQELFDACMYDLEYAQWDIDNYELLLDRWDECHDKEGNAIFPPERIQSYLCGDYIKGVEADGTPINNTL